MSIFGKKPSDHGISEGDSQSPNFDLPNLDKYAYQTNTGTKSVAKSPSAPAMQPPQVQKAMPPSVTHAPILNPAQGQAPSPTASTSTRTLHPQTLKESAEVQQKSPYTFEDVIQLMRELPDSKKEMVVAIVQKTLISAKIDVAAIIDDAGRRVDKLARHNDKLASEIRELEQAIVVKKGEVDRLARELDETSAVKQIFEVTYGRHVRGEGENSPDKQAPPAIKLF